MYQKDLAKRAWTDAGLYRSDDPKLLEFLSKLDKSPLDCWSDLVAEGRLRFPEYKQQLVEPLWASGDKLLRLNLLRWAEPDRPDELQVLQRWMEAADPVGDARELLAMARLDNALLLDRLLAKPGISGDLAQEVQVRLARLQARPGASLRPGDRVQLTKDLPEKGLVRGGTGQVVEVRPAQPLSYVVTFAGPSARKTVKVEVTADQVSPARAPLEPA